MWCSSVYIVARWQNLVVSAAYVCYKTDDDDAVKDTYIAFVS